MLLGRTPRSPAAGSGPHTAFVDEENDVSMEQSSRREARARRRARQ